MARVYPYDVYDNPVTWPKARRLDAIAIGLVDSDEALPTGAELLAADILTCLDSYRDAALAAYAEAQKLSERALVIREKILGSDHPQVALSLNSIGLLLNEQGNPAKAKQVLERSLAIREKAFGDDGLATANSLNSLGYLTRNQGSFNEARGYYERALSIVEKVTGAESPEAAMGIGDPREGVRP